MSTDQEHHIPDAPAPQRERPPARKRNPVLLYLVILFAVAFLLLLFSFFCQQRSNREALNNLEQTSSSAAQSLENLIRERDELKEENAALTEETDNLRAQLAEETNRAEQAQAALEQSVRAMDLFWQIDEAYAQGKYTLCRSLIQAMEEQSLTGALPTQSTTDNGRFSPADRYQEIYSALY